jgi:hypothetical protein
MSPAPAEIIAVQEALESKCTAGPVHLSADVVMALAKVLSDISLSQANGRTDRQELSVFFSIQPPSLDIASYLSRIMEYFACTHECYVMASVYIDRIARCHPEFPISQLSAHRLLLASVLVATKFNDDTYYSNEWYANVGGVSNADLNRMEIEFLKLLDWNVNVTRDEFDRHASLLCAVTHRRSVAREAIPIRASVSDAQKAGLHRGHWCDGRRDRAGRACGRFDRGERVSSKTNSCRHGAE